MIDYNKINEKWAWNWTDLCGLHGNLTPFNPDTDDFGICFQQLCLQIPTLALLAITSAYYCGKKVSNGQHDRFSHYAITLRLIITICLVILPIIKAYIILMNTTISNVHFVELNTGALNAGNETIYPSNQATSAKPIDYLVAGTEGLTWTVHFCFILSLKTGTRLSIRGPVIIRALIFMLLGISALILQTHIKHNTPLDVLPNLSLGFSIAVVTLVILYTLTLLPIENSPERVTPRYAEMNEHTTLLNSPNSSYIHFPEEQNLNYLGTAMESATFLSKLLFNWVTPLMEKGARGLLKHPDDLYDFPEHMTMSSIIHRINRYVRKQSNIRERSVDVDENVSHAPEYRYSMNGNISLLRLLHQCFGWQFYIVGVLKFIADCSGFVGPMLLNKLIGFVEDKSEPLSYGYLYASLMFIAAATGAITTAHFTFWMSIVGLKIRGTIIALVYRKILRSSNVQLNQEFTLGEIVNFMSTDSDRIVNSCPSFHTFWSIPLQLFVTLYLLYRQIGLSFFAGVIFTIILIPVNKFIASKIGILSAKMMEYKDRRVRLMGETLRGLTVIKFNVWEEYFLSSILKLREKEMKYLKRRKYLDALCVYFWATTPILISALTFATYVLLGNTLDAKTVFTSMALLNMLIAPLNSFPWVLNGLTEAWVSVKRIQRLLDLMDLEISTYYSDPPLGIDILLKDASFIVNGSLERDKSTLMMHDDYSPLPSTSASTKLVSNNTNEIFVLKNLNIEVKKGQLIGVIGKIGSGKSLLLNAILAEITKTNGLVAINGLDIGLAYVKQHPWIQRGTIRDNILFGKAYDCNKYKSVLKACALMDDLISLPNKDLTGVGEAGNTLSGGQKTRISLARAVYADKNIYLLDDILATLDTKVSRYIFQNVILGLLKNKTRVICTHQTQYLIHADIVLEMSEGQIINQGLPNDVLPDLDDFLLSSGSIDSELDIASTKNLYSETNEFDYQSTNSLLDEEYIEQGTLQFGVYGVYLNAVGKSLIVSILLSMVLMQSSQNITDLWLSFWVTHVNTTIVNSTILSQTHEFHVFTNNSATEIAQYYLTIYGLLAFSNSVFTLIRAFIFAYGGIYAATSIHKQLLTIIIKARTCFFDSQSMGRILNRFSSDTYTVDDSLPFIVNILLAQFFALIGRVIVTTYGLPWILLVLAPLIPVYHWVQHRYRLTSRELKRLSSTSLSPLYTHFNETLQGLSSIKAFRAVPRFKHENELFLEANQKTNFASVAVAQWLALRLQFIAVALLIGVTIMAVLQRQFDMADPGLIGLAITYALSITGLLSGVVNVYTETEREMISVERIKQYLDNVPVENSIGDNPPYAWPSQGVVEFRDVVLRYREHLEPSLNGISFMTRPAEKIGIIGRTGSGKSSIFNSLFRLVEIDNGQILIDNVIVKNLQLNALRSRLSIIPQNPFLFSGTIRENIDPLDQYPDSQIFRALNKCKLTQLVQRCGGLGAMLEENGDNLSAGQKQLLCLVRAILHNAKILCIDEATANVDPDTDKAIQSTIKSSFRSATVITIAHRIQTIMHCDRVLVLENGQIQEFDEPNVLMDNIHSYFYQLVTQQFSDHE